MDARPCRPARAAVGAVGRPPASNQSFTGPKGPQECPLSRLSQGAKVVRGARRARPARRIQTRYKQTASASTASWVRTFTVAANPWGPTSPTKNVGCRLKGDHPNARAAGDRALVAAARQGVPSRRRRQRRNLRRRRGLSSPVEGDQRVQRRLRGDRPNAVVARGGPSSPVEGRRRGAGVDGRGGRPNPRAVESMEPGESISRIPKGHRNVGSLACLTKITQGQSNLWELGIAERRPR